MHNITIEHPTNTTGHRNKCQFGTRTKCKAFIYEISSPIRTDAGPKSNHHLIRRHKIDHPNQMHVCTYILVVAFHSSTTLKSTTTQRSLLMKKNFLPETISANVTSRFRSLAMYPCRAPWIRTRLSIHQLS